MDYRTDDTGFGNIRVIQTKGSGYGVDAVLLAGFAAGETGAAGIREGGRAADLGTGSGIVGFILTHKVAGITVTGIENNEEAAGRAQQACLLNGLEDRVTISVLDVNEIEGKHDYDAVVSNPPYFRRDSVPEEARSRTDGRYTARHETTADIWDFARAAASMLKNGGSLYLVHRPDRLPDIFEAMRAAGIEPKTLQMVVPVHGEPANIVLVHGIAGAGAELRILPEIAVRNGNGDYTDDILRLYERGPYAKASSK